MEQIVTTTTDNPIRKSSRAEIDTFLAQKRVAVVGVSGSSRDFSRKLFQELLNRGYEVVPVNPRLNEVEGKACYARVKDITPPVDAALLLTSPKVTDEVVEDCAAAGVKYIWMYGTDGPVIRSDRGATTLKSVAYCQEHGMNVVAGECPFMFLPGTGFPHRVHGIIRRIRRTYPR